MLDEERNNLEEEKVLPLTGHLEELRARLFRAALYITFGMSLSWIFYARIFAFLEAPILASLKQYNEQLQLLELTEGFMVRMQTSFIAGLIVTLPFLLFELWGFIKPGLTNRERRVIRAFPLVITFLFLLGAAFGYWMAPLFAKWMLSASFVVPGTKPQLRVAGAILFMAKLLLAFGLGFQLPVLIVLLNRLGILPRAALMRRWREATLVIYIIAAIVTPTWDPITMTIAALPLALLYAGTLGVIQIMERRERKAAAKLEADHET